MKVFVTGLCGYVGTVLAERLLAAGHNVYGYDEMYFGNHIKQHTNLTLFVSDIRDQINLRVALDHAKPDVVIHLACISNDPSFELDESLSRTINYEAFEPLVLAAKATGVKRFIYASSSSVYGISDSPNVTEEHPLVPVTLYNTYKAMCEPLLFQHTDDNFVGVVVRPSTVCGYSPRLRLDLAVNILTHLAIAKRCITVFGGKQMRPNLHIDDMVDAYMLLLDAPAEKIQNQIFNIGIENLSIAELADLAQHIVAGEMPHLAPITIETSTSMDTRSYQVNSDKIADVLGFRPKYRVGKAIVDLCEAFSAGLVPNSLEDDNYYNVRRMRAVWADLYKGAPPSAFDPNAGILSEIDLKRLQK